MIKLSNLLLFSIGRKCVLWGVPVLPSHTKHRAATVLQRHAHARNRRRAGVLAHGQRRYLRHNFRAVPHGGQHGCARCNVFHLVWRQGGVRARHQHVRFNVIKLPVLNFIFTLVCQKWHFLRDICYPFSRSSIVLQLMVNVTIVFFCFVNNAECQ